MQNKELHRPTLRVLHILEAAANTRTGVTLTEMAERISAPKTSILPILCTLANQGYLYYNRQSMRYFIGMKAYEIGQNYMERSSSLKDISEIILNMVNVCGETAHFAILDGGSVLYLITHDSPDRVRIFSPSSVHLPAYATSLGKALMLDYSLTQLKTLYPEEPLSPLTPNTITSVDRLYEQLQGFKAEQITSEHEESNSHISCYAVPIRKKQKIIAALSISIPHTRFTPEKVELCKILLKNTRNRIEELVNTNDLNF